MALKRDSRKETEMELGQESAAVFVAVIRQVVLSGTVGPGSSGREGNICDDG